MFLEELGKGFQRHTNMVGGSAQGHVSVNVWDAAIAPSTIIADCE